MTKREQTSPIIDAIIRLGSTTAFIAAGFIAPNIVQALDKPMRQLHASLDSHARSREVMRVIRNMRAQGYLVGDYQHGLQLTPKALTRLRKIQLKDASIKSLPRWDHRWRIVIYDIPESHKGARNHLTTALRQAGCVPLQKSAWITPFPCRELIATLCAYYFIDDFVSYFEAIGLDNETEMVAIMKKKYPSTNFS